MEVTEGDDSLPQLGSLVTAANSSESHYRLKKPFKRNNNSLMHSLDTVAFPAAKNSSQLFNDSSTLARTRVHHTNRSKCSSFMSNSMFKQGGLFQTSGILPQPFTDS